ncbi:YkyA family protein [Salipaludibacillus sp. HK11]|uniref:YkyA family protein n=1 Tax=Salipaludibacillus sp. HK11 TaxID=3394320 RepID=UPI0039FDB090
MKLFIGKTLTFVGIGLIMVGCFNNELDASEYVVNDTELGDSQDEVEERLGTANDIDTSVINDKEYTTLSYENVAFIFVDNNVVGISSIDEDHETDQGIGIGSERSQAEDVYEEEEYIQDSYGMMVKNDEILLHMLFNQDEVISIRLSDLSEMTEYLEYDLGFDVYAVFQDQPGDIKLAPQNPAKLIYDQIEEAAHIETEITDYQESLHEAESNEMTWYDEMLSLPTVEEIEPIADQAIESANTRGDLIEEEKKMMEESFHSFQDGEKHIERIDEEETSLIASELAETMTERYEKYLELNEEYLLSINEDIILYEMIKNDEVELDELREQHDSVNELYNQIIEFNDQFNQLTNDYNEVKRAFYESSELNVAYE